MNNDAEKTFYAFIAAEKLNRIKLCVLIEARHYLDCGHSSEAVELDGSKTITLGGYEVQATGKAFDAPCFAVHLDYCQDDKALSEQAMALFEPGNILIVEGELEMPGEDFPACLRIDDLSGVRRLPVEYEVLTRQLFFRRQ